HHVRSKKSVRPYFVPVVPYGTDNYLICPICSRGLPVKNGQLPYLRSMSEATASLRAGRLSQDRYRAQAERLWRQLGMNPAGQQPSAPVPVPPAPAPPDADDPRSWLSQLRQLAQLHDQGALSDTAFADA